MTKTEELIAQLPTKGIKMLVWDDEESEAVEREIFAYMKEFTYPFLTSLPDGWEEGRMGAGGGKMPKQ